MAFKMCEGISCSWFSVKEVDVIAHKIISLHNHIHFLAILYPTLLANPVVEVGTRQCHNILLKLLPYFLGTNDLTHSGRVTHICVNDLTSIGSDNGLSPDRRQAIIRTNAGILLIRPLGTNFSEFLVEVLIFSFKKMRLKVSSAKRRSFCLGLNDLTHWLMFNFKLLITRY